MSYRKVLNRRAKKIRRNIRKMENKGFVLEKPCYTPVPKLYTHLKEILERKQKAREIQSQRIK